MADISAKITRKSLKAKRRSAIKNIKDQAKEKIREINIEYAEDPALKRSRQSNKEQRKAYRAQKRNARIAYNVRQPRLYTLGEDVFNSVTHGLGAGLSVAALVILVVRACLTAPASIKPLCVCAMSLFGASLFILYMMSTLYHAIPSQGARKVFSILNHCAIYLVIASSYTPFAFICIGGKYGWILFGLAWGFSILFLTLYAVFGARLRFFSVLTYIVMGWLFFAASPFCTEPLSSYTMVFIVSGGVAYTVGAAFYCLRNYKWAHSIFHVFALAGSILQFFAVYSII